LARNKEEKGEYKKKRKMEKGGRFKVHGLRFWGWINEFE
jgi:hypothetical protein